MDRRKQPEPGRGRDRKGNDPHPGARGEKIRVPENPKESRPESPLGNGGTNDPAAFPPHN